MKRNKSALMGILVGMIAFSFVYIATSEAAEPIKMGVISAWDFIGGHGTKRAAEMGIKKINDQGGILGRKVEGVFYDNKGDPGEAKNATERVLYRDKVDVVCGYWRSDLAIACQPLVMEAKKILLLGGAAAPILTKGRIKDDYNTYKYTFSAMSNSLLTMRPVEQSFTMVKNLGLSKMAILIEKAAWCDPIYNHFMKTYPDRIVYSTRFSTTATDFSVEFSKAKAAGADTLVVFSTGRGGIPSVKQWYDMKIPALYIGYPEAAQDPNFWKITEGKCQGVAGTHIGGLLGLPITEKSLPYYEEYREVYGEYPIAYTNAVVYDVIMAWAQGVKLAGSIESDAVLKAMERENFNYVGVSGVLERFNEIHNPVGGGWPEDSAWGWSCFQWQNGKREITWPEAHKTKDMIIPDRIKKLMGK
jgi:branched-chain amino acid transport system substrate-binding protein